MGFRFRRSIKIAPGVRLNLGKRGVSMSAGVRGASVNVGKRGMYGNVGLPGTGLSYRTRLASGGQSRGTTAGAPRTAAPAVPQNIMLALQSDGRVELRAPDGTALPDRLRRVVQAQHGARIQQWLEDQCEALNEGIDRILNLHLETPPPTSPGAFVPEPFRENAPAEPVMAEPSFWERWMPGKTAKIEQSNIAAIQEHEREMAEWRHRKSEHERREAIQRRVFDAASRGDQQAMEQMLQAVLEDLDWPRETDVNFDIAGSGSVLFLDVDLPEIEDLPARVASIAARGMKLNIKAKSDAERRKDYMRHIHAVAFRLLGECFQALPSVRTIVLSAYSQRPDPGTGRIRDDYLLSVRVSRSAWSAVDFAHLEQLDLPSALERFELRRSMTRTGLFRPIEPFAPPGAT